MGKKATWAAVAADLVLAVHQPNASDIVVVVIVIIITCVTDRIEEQVEKLVCSGLVLTISDEWMCWYPPLSCSMPG